MKQPPVRVVGLSGPPRSGKDTICDALAEHITTRYRIAVDRVSLATPMRKVVYTLLGMDFDPVHYHDCKDEPQEMFAGTSIRQAMIDISEEYVKPKYGQNFWARSAIQAANPAAHILIVSDMGFDIEVETFETIFGVENCAWINLYREGTNFSKDSRSHVGSPGRTLSLYNNGTVDEAVQKLAFHLFDWHNWKKDY